MKRLYALSVAKKGDLSLTVHFSSYEAAAEANHALKKEGFSVEGLQNYPVSLCGKGDLDHVLAMAHAFCD